MNRNNSVTELFKMKVVFSITLRDNNQRKVELLIVDNLRLGKSIFEIVLLRLKEEKLNLVVKKIKGHPIISGDLKSMKKLMDRKSSMLLFRNKDILLRKDLYLLLSIKTTKVLDTLTTLPTLNLLTNRKRKNI